MRRSTVRLLRSCFTVALLTGFLGFGSWGCIPSFRGLQPVTTAELQPKTKSSAPAEILFWKEYRSVWYGQVGQPPQMTFRRVYKRVRINTEKGLKAATISRFGGKLLAFQARSSCPGGRVTSVDLDDIPEISKQTSYYPFVRWSDKGSVTISASGATVGCVVDFYWEEDIPGTIAARGTVIPLVQEFPIQKAHIRIAYANLQAVRPSLLYMDGLWMMLHKKMMAKSKGDAKMAPMTEKEQEQYVRIKHNSRARQVDLWLADIPGISRRKALALGLQAKAALLPEHFTKPPTFTLMRTRTYGIGGKEVALVWRNLDEAYTTRRSWYQEDRSGIQRSYQIDEEEELKKDGIAGIARKVAGSAANRAAKIKAIHEHLRQRMLVTTNNVYTGNKLNYVYLLGRGSSYEINMMFVVMLRAVGIRAYAALAVPDNRIFQELPPNPLFKTAVVYVPATSEGKWRGLCDERKAARAFLDQKGDGYQGGRKAVGGAIYDPANKYLPIGTISAKYNNASVFVIDGAGGRFFEVDDPNPARNKTVHTSNLKVLADGSLSGTIKISTWGNHASKSRWMFHKVNPTLWEKQHVGLSAKGSCLSQSQLSLVQAPNLDGNALQEPFTYTYKVQTSPCVTHGKHGFLFTPNWGFRLPTLVAPVRVYPISLGDPGVQQRNISISFPAGYTPKVASRSVASTGPGGLNTKLAIASKGSVLTVKIHHQSNQRTLPPSDYAKVKSHFGSFSFAKKWQVVVAR